MGMLERVAGAAILGMAVYELSKFSFSYETRMRVRREQHNLCADCHRPAFLEIHHRVPQSMNGANNRRNAVGLCHECHQEWDKLAKNEGVVFPGKLLEQLSVRFFKSNSNHRL